MASRVGEQLRLPFPEELDAPWGGQSPRVLTRGHLVVIFKPRGGKSVSDFVDPAQIDMFPEASDGPPHQYAGAPCLVPLPEWGVVDA